METIITFDRFNLFKCFSFNMATFVIGLISSLKLIVCSDSNLLLFNDNESFVKICESFANDDDDDNVWSDDTEDIWIPSLLLSNIFRKSLSWILVSNSTNGKISASGKKIHLKLILFSDKKKKKKYKPNE